MLWGKKPGFAGSPQTNWSTNVFDVTRDLVIRHHTYIDLIQGFVVMKSGIPVAGEATAHDRAEDVGAARVGDLGAPINILIIEVLSFHLHVPGKPDLRGYALFDGDLPGNVAVDNNLCISVRKRGTAGVTILYRHVTGER